MRIFSLLAKSPTAYVGGMCRTVCTRFTLVCLATFLGSVTSAWSFVTIVEGTGTELSNFYTYYIPLTPHPVSLMDSFARRTINPPELVVLGGGAALVPNNFAVATASSMSTIGSAWLSNALSFQPRFPREPCRDWPTFILYPVRAGHVIEENYNWYDSLSICFSHELNGTQGMFEPGHTWTLTQRVSFEAPLRRAAVDGGQYDASRMRMVRAGVPWMTYHWGYRLGLVAGTANWDAANLYKVPELATWPTFPDAKDNFELVSLPPPWVEDDVVEYVNRVNFPAQPGGQYFYAVLASDKTLLDSIPAWQRSGKSFKSGGYVSACRFYGGKNGGPNTHFYSADDKECTALKTIPQLSYEGQTFAVNMPLPGANADGSKPCPIDSKPLFRVYNNASASNGKFVSNHRYLIERTDVVAAVAQGWLDEGQAMCVPM